MVLKIEKDYGRDELLDKYTISMLKDRYMLPHEKSPQDAFARAAHTYSGGDDDLAQRIYDYASNLWFMFSTPILTNASTSRGLPISCFLNSVDDSRGSIFSTYTECGWLSSNGGGVGTYWGNLRSIGTATSTGSETSGVIPFIKIQDSLSLGIQQGKTRRGAHAVYLDISHPEIEEFLTIRKPSGGDTNRKALNLHHGVNISDDFMSLLESSIADDTLSDAWGLVDPHTKEVVRTVSAKALWKKILELRMETGEPYVHFIDTTNRLQPDCHSSLGLRVAQSNLCSEIVLPTNSQRTAVCCLSSVNLEYFDDWKDTTMVRDIVRFLDNVLQYFIDNAGEGYEKAVYSATQSRDLGLGAMGFHAYLQKNNIPFEGPVAIGRTKTMFEYIRSEAEKESSVLGLERGSAPDFGPHKWQFGVDYASNKEVLDEQKGKDKKPISSEMYRPLCAKSVRLKRQAEKLGIDRWEGDVESKAYSDLRDKIKMETPHKRNVHLMAIAPNASSSIICGNTSPSVEPYRANAYSQKTMSGTNVVKNKYLDRLLHSKFTTNADSPEVIKEAEIYKVNLKDFADKKKQEVVDVVWKSIIENGGSVQHLDILTEHEKDVFKTAIEIDQGWIIEHAAMRQEYIDQSQSINLFFEPTVDKKYLHDIHFAAWKRGLKTLYYCRSEAVSRPENINRKTDRYNYEAGDCLSCEG